MLAVMCSNRPYHILVADDYPRFRECLKELLSDDSGIEVIGEAGDGLEVLSFLDRSPTIPDLAILDISMPNLGGIEVTELIRKAHPGIKVLILTMFSDEDHLRRALAAGAEGYLLKEDAAHELLCAISALRDGCTYLSPSLSAARC